VLIRNARFAIPNRKDSRAAVLFTAETKQGSQNIQFRDCVVEGPYRDGAFNFDGSATGVDIRHCRVWNSASGVCFRAPKPETAWRVEVTGNTFHTMTRAGFWFKDAAAMKRPDILITVLQNYFIGMSPVVLAENPDLTNAKFVKAEGNFRKTGSQPGPLVEADELNIDLPNEPGDRAQFLTYDRTSPLFKAFKGEPVGAPPPY